jgi:uncharacterized protein YndB with AHSA1/START domain
MFSQFRFAMAILLCVCHGLLSNRVGADDHLSTAAEAITSEVMTTGAGGLVLVQKVLISAPLEDVWMAYTTAEGWTGWAAPNAEIDLRVGGTIRTAYEGEVGGNKTNTLQIVNYVPNRLLTLKADVSKNWPDIMQKDADKLSNVVLFETNGPNETQVQSFGIGYSDTPEYQQLLNFFIPANEALLKNLKAYVETNQRFDWSE